METKQNQAEIEETSVCAACGEKFDQPLLTELHSEGIIEEYYACPRCLSKVSEVDYEKKREVEETEEEPELPIEEAETVEAPEPAETESKSSCPYKLGYLKKREKNVPIPDSCFVCTKMIECLT